MNIDDPGFDLGMEALLCLGPPDMGVTAIDLGRDLGVDWETAVEIVREGGRRHGVGLRMPIVDAGMVICVASRGAFRRLQGLGGAYWDRVYGGSVPVVGVVRAAGRMGGGVGGGLLVAICGVGASRRAIRARKRRGAALGRRFRGF